MICKNCSAKISDEVLLCPYCGTENQKVAQKEQQEYIDGYKHKKRKLKKVPEKVVRKTTKGLVYGAGITLGIIILALIVVVAFSVVAERFQHFRQIDQSYSS